MSSNATLILGAIETRIQAVTTGYVKLKYSYELEKNSGRGGSKGYGFGAGAAETESGVNKSVTKNQTFFVVISESMTNRNSDSGEDAALKAAYDTIELIENDFMSSKLGLASTVIVVESFGLDEPTKIGENTITIKANFVVKHRKATT